MENYKLVNSREVQEKAFRLGYGWDWGSCKQVKCLDKPFLFLYGEDKDITMSDAVNTYLSKHSHKEITTEDFLKLEEPFIKGDWVQFTNGFGSIIFKVCFVEGVGEALTLHDVVSEEDYFASYCVKLTKEQIDCLGLE